MAISKNSHFWCCEADAGELDRFVFEKILPQTGLLYPAAEISLMALVVDRVRPTHIFEWGTNIGGSARIFHTITEVLEIDAEIHTWDLPENVPHGQHPGKDHGKLARGLPRIHFHREDGLQGALAKMESERAQSPNFRPLYFVDGDHSYASVIREIAGLVSVQDEFHLLAHDTFIQKPDAKGQSRESWLGCPTALEAFAKDYRWLNVGFGNPGMAYLWGRGKRNVNPGLRLRWLGLLDRLETRLEKVIYKGIRALRSI
jgi:cephalosporin hydroxylase